GALPISAGPGPAPVHRSDGTPHTSGSGRLHAGGRDRRQAEPPVAPALPDGASGVCALGEAYGHWPAGSPQARICHQAYGH
ncbi:hypothetical protein JFN87_11725, partial [Streptomyces bomunensis]|nr:hypothetical protein [Streptomyces montanisoli]